MGVIARRIGTTNIHSLKPLLNLSVIAFNLITLMYILKEIKKAAKSDEVSEAYLRNACTEHLVSSIYSLSLPGLT